MASGWGAAIDAFDRRQSVESFARQVALGIAATVSLLACLIPSSAVLAADSEEDALNKRGVEARKRNDDATAWEIFHQAYELHHSARSAAQMGLAEMALGRWADAEQHLSEALRASDDAWIRKNEKVLREALASVRDQFGTLQVLGRPAGAVVVVEGRVVGTLPMDSPARVRVGDCPFDVHAPGFAEARRTVVIAARKATRETVELVALPATAPDRGGAATGTSAREHYADSGTGASGAGSGGAMSVGSPGTSNPSRDLAGDASQGRETGSIRRIAFLGAAGLGVGALAFAIIEHLSWQHKVSSFGDMAGCDAALPARGGAGCQKLYDDGRRAQTFAFVGYGVAVGMAATAVVLYATEPSHGAGAGKVACVMDPLAPAIGCRLRF